MGDSTDRWLLNLALQLTDGSAPDWDGAETSAPEDLDPAILAQLRIVDGIREIHSGAGEIEAPGATPRPERLAGPTARVATEWLNGTLDMGTPAESGSVSSNVIPGWGHLEDLQPIGCGSFGDVYRAWESKLSIQVALKLLKVSDRPGTGRRELVSRLLDEGRRLARVRHPNVIHVYGADERDGKFGLWMELVEGTTMEGLVRERGPLSDREAAGVVLDVCRALSAVHQAGIVHRDISARNVMREKGGRILLMDFGAGSERCADGSAADPSAAGTPYYMAPEVLRGRKATVRSDLYSCGVLLYYLLTGSYPVDATTVGGLKAAHERPLRLVRDVRPDLPDAIVRVVERALSKEPEKRYASAGEMAMALSQAIAPTEGSTAVAASRSRWRWAVLAFAAGLAALVVVWLGIRGRETATGAAPRAAPPGAYEVTASFHLGQEGRRLRHGDRVHPGDALFVRLQTSDSLFAYVINEDENGEVFVLFPDPSLEIGNPLPPGNHRLPGFRGGRMTDWQVTSAGGVERFWILASPGRLTDVEIELAALARPAAGGEVLGAPGDEFEIGNLRGVGGFVEREAVPLVHTKRLMSAAEPLSDTQEIVSGTYARRIELENPAR